MRTPEANCTSDSRNTPRVMPEVKENEEDGQGSGQRGFRSFIAYFRIDTQLLVAPRTHDCEFHTDLFLQELNVY